MPNLTVIYAFRANSVQEKVAVMRHLQKRTRGEKADRSLAPAS